jgi:hypothetical protein
MSIIIQYIFVIKQLNTIQNSKDFTCTQSDEAGRINYKLQKHHSLAVIGGNSKQQYLKIKDPSWNPSNRKGNTFFGHYNQVINKNCQLYY